MATAAAAEGNLCSYGRVAQRVNNLSTERAELRVAQVLSSGAVAEGRKEGRKVEEEREM